MNQAKKIEADVVVCGCGASGLVAGRVMKRSISERQNEI